MKKCLYCREILIRKRWSNGKLDSTFKNRKFCSSKCYGLFGEAKGKATKASGRKTAQRRVKMVECNRCQSKKNLQRHHIDRNPRNNSAENIEVLCQTCHKDDHMKDGTWGIAGYKNRIFREFQEELKNASTDLKGSETP